MFRNIDADTKITLFALDCLEQSFCGGISMFRRSLCVALLINRRHASLEFLEADQMRDLEVVRLHNSYINDKVKVGLYKASAPLGKLTRGATVQYSIMVAATPVEIGSK